uniref:Acyl transferase n=1 Tax=Streptomyces sp. R1128 TaxID=140437 RepID=Q9F6D9_9ACTN|nr:acyl transferase [Streptomyces sp. R1128]
MTIRLVPPRRRVALLLPGQGSQHPGMGLELYGYDGVFTETMDEMFELLGPVDGASLRADWLAGDALAPELLNDASRAQPLLFAVEYALGRSLLSQGVDVDVLLGHSVGELSAAALAGVVDLPGAARVMAARTAALAALPPGGMLAVAATAEELAPFVAAEHVEIGVVVGALNAPRQTVLAGPEPRLTEVEGELRAAGVMFRRVPARQPFHSPASAPAAEVVEKVLSGVTLREPTIPIMSTHSGAYVTREQALDPAFWAWHFVRVVLFWPALDALLSEADHALVELGPGQELTVLARRHKAVRSGASTVRAVLPRGARGTREAWDDALAELAEYTGPAGGVPLACAAER